MSDLQTSSRPGARRTRRPCESEAGGRGRPNHRPLWVTTARALRLLLLVVGCALLPQAGGCAVSSSRPQPPPPAMPPVSAPPRTEILPTVSARPRAEQVGYASWYGPGFHGRLTASGEVYNQHALTAAHRTLPLGSRAVVTNLANGQSVQVRITDRGPFIRGRVIDLSRGAARALGMLKPGISRVRIAPLREAHSPASAPPEM
jgi:rare lipoprotein A